MKSLSMPFQERKGQWKACIGIEILSLPINLVVMSIAYPASSHEYFLSILNYKTEYQVLKNSCEEV